MSRGLGCLAASAMLIACAIGGAGTDLTATSGPASTTTVATTLPSSSSTSPTSPGTSTTTSTSPPETDPGAIETVLVANEDGLSRIDGEDITQIVEGPVVTGIGDRQGGVVFQRDWSPGEIFWMPAGETDSRSVVAPGEDHGIRLEDVVLGDDGPVIWYTRDFGSGPDDSTTVLYTMSPNTGAEVEMGLVGGWESGSTVSVGAGLVVSEWWGEASHGFTTHDTAFGGIETPWNPYDAEGELDCGPCPRAVDVADDGSRVTWIEGRKSGDFFVPTLVLTGTVDGEEILALPLPGDLLGTVANVDLGDSSVLISHGSEDLSVWLPPLKVDIEDGLILQIEVSGEARWGSWD